MLLRMEAREGMVVRWYLGGGERRRLCVGEAIGERVEVDRLEDVVAVEEWDVERAWEVMN